MHRQCPISWNVSCQPVCSISQRSRGSILRCKLQLPANRSQLRPPRVRHSRRKATFGSRLRRANDPLPLLPRTRAQSNTSPQLRPVQYHRARHHRRFYPICRLRLGRLPPSSRCCPRCRPPSRPHPLLFFPLLHRASDLTLLLPLVLWRARRSAVLVCWRVLAPMDRLRRRSWIRWHGTCELSVPRMEWTEKKARFTAASDMCTVNRRR